MLLPQHPIPATLLKLLELACVLHAPPFGLLKNALLGYFSSSAELVGIKAR